MTGDERGGVTVLALALVVLAAVVALGVARAGGAAGRSARADTAADAAALAAAETLARLGGDDAALGAARTAAAANGAVLRRCDCTGDHAEVTVVLDDAVGRARARRSGWTACSPSSSAGEVMRLHERAACDRSELFCCYRPAMRSGALAGLLVVVALVVAGCGGSQDLLTNEFGGCTFEPHTKCPGMDLAGVVVSESDLRGADFVGANLEGADFRQADLRDANLAGADLTHADFTRADLRGADMSDAILTSATFEHADWVGSNRSSARLCKTILPEGTASGCKVLDVPVPVDRTPASIVEFAPVRPVACIDDFVGDGIMVEWKIAHSDSAVFLVDDIQATSAQGTGGSQRVPIACDGNEHTVTIQALGGVPPVATASFTVTLQSPAAR